MVGISLRIFVYVVMLFRRQFIDANRATRSAIARMAEAVPFFRNSVLKAKDCTPLPPQCVFGFCFLVLAGRSGYIKPNLTPPLIILHFV